MKIYGNISEFVYLAKDGTWKEPPVVAPITFSRRKCSEWLRANSDGKMFGSRITSRKKLTYVIVKRKFC